MSIIKKKYEMLTVNRKDIKLANYNPRYIDEESRKRLKKAMKEYGLVQPLILNKRTGTLVSGHQRLSILDEDYKNKDYQIEVAVIDVDEKTEKRLNVQLNNASMMGDFDIDKLQDLALDIGIDDLGFSDAEKDLYFNDESFAQDFNSSQEAAQTKGILENMKKDRKKMMETKKAENSADFYVTIIFDSSERKHDFLKKLNIPVYEDFIPADKLIKICDF